MIHIKYKVKSSAIDGVGLFANEDLKMGDIIYTPSPLLDVDISQEKFQSLSSVEQDEVSYYGYFNKKTNKWHVAFDMIRVLNHSEEPNITQDEGMVMIAKMDILKDQSQHSPWV